MFCPQCGTSLPDYAVKCTSCGAAVPAAAPVVAVAGGAAPVPALAGARETKTCPFCGEEILKSAIRCRFCQADLQAGATSQNLQAPAPNQNSTGITVQGPQLPANQPTIVIQNVQTQQGPPMIRQYKNPGVALALAMIFPGAGQFYNGHIGKGILVLVTAWLVIPYIWSWFDAYSCAKRINAVGF